MQNQKLYMSQTIYCICLSAVLGTTWDLSPAPLVPLKYNNM